MIERKEHIADLKTYSTYYKEADVYKTGKDSFLIILCRHNASTYCTNAEFVGHITRNHNFGLQYARHSKGNFQYMTKRDILLHIQTL